MKHFIHLSAAALALTIAGAAVAAENPAMTPPLPVPTGSAFGTLDANKDGRLSQSEVRSNTDLNGRFSVLDSDGDTYLSMLEYGKWEGSNQRPIPGTGNRTAPTDPRVGPADPSNSSSTGVGNKPDADRAPQ